MVTMTNSYQEALTNAAGAPTVVPGSPEEKAGIERFKDFFAELSEEGIRAKVRHVYAKDVYFNDTLKEAYGIDALEPYLLESAAAVESCRVDIGDLAVNNGNYYFRWVMDIQFKSLKKGQITRSIGVSHIRFDEEGKICLHQDYWDSTSGLFEHMPVVGYLLRKIKARL
jgi:limonene-1,2-epoxide hydrolase